MKLLQPAISGFGVILVKTAMNFSIDSYKDNFTDMPDAKILLASSSDDYETPVFYALEYQSNLWIVSRGSMTGSDFETCAAFDEATTKYGIFHEGAYKSALYTFDSVKSYIEKYEKIYFTGHSLGGTIAPILATIVNYEYPNKDVNCIAFAPIPMMDNQTEARMHDKIATIVYDVDMVPTLSVPNFYMRFQFLIPLFKHVPDSGLIAFITKFLSLFEVFDEKTVKDLEDVIPQLIEAFVAYAKGQERYIRYVPGWVYQIPAKNNKKIDDLVIDPVEKLNILSVAAGSWMIHNAEVYERIILKLPE